jgi:murein hydrolase activator
VRLALVLGLALLPVAALLAAPAAPDPLADQQGRLLAARGAAVAARAKADRLDADAAAEHDGGRRAAFEQSAIAARVDAAEADLAVANARVAILSGLLAEQRDQLALRQAPVARLLGALQSTARRPAIVALLEPGSVDDLVHLRAVLGAIQPAIAARTADVRAALDRSRRLRGDAALAATSLGEGRARLEKLRLQLVQLQAAGRLSARATGPGALTESEQAIALGERARDIAGDLAAGNDLAQTREALETVDTPLPRPPRPGVAGEAVSWSSVAPPYRLPVSGRLVTGLGELSDAGVRSRGLSFAVAPGAAVVAPTAGRIAFAGPFRDYGLVVIIDHGEGWTTLLSGLGTVAIQAGAHVGQGALIGHARPGDPPVVTVELRRRGRAVDITALAG